MNQKDKLFEAYLKILTESNINYLTIEAQVDNGDKDRQTIEYFKEQIKHNNHKPILINKDKEVLDGNHRLKAYQELNIEPPLLYQGERVDFFNVAKEADYDGIKMIELMILNGTAKKIL